jgi:hypothetical protein
VTWVVVVYIEKKCLASSVTIALIIIFKLMSNSFTRRKILLSGFQKIVSVL